MTARTDALGGLTTTEWDRLVGRHFYSSSGWLAYCAAEYSAPGSAVVSTGPAGEPRCAVPVFDVAEPALLSLYRWNDLLDGFGLPRLPAEGLLVGPPEGYQTRLLAPPDGPQPAAVRDLVDRLRAAAGPGRACVAPYLSTDAVAALRAAGVAAPPVLLDADAWIEVPAGGWDAWLATLSSKRRGTVRKDVEAFRAAGYRIEHTALAGCYRDLAVAAAATVSKNGHPVRPEDEAEALRSQAVHMGDAARVAVCSRAGRPVAFCLYYLWRDTIFLRWAGFDYEYLAGAAEYFNVTYYTQIRLAAEVGARWVHAGIKSTEAKALRGARLRPLWLLDLAPDSPLTAAADRVRAHNAAVLRRLDADPRTAAALDLPEWTAFGGSEPRHRG